MEKEDRIMLHRRFLFFYKKDTLALFFSFVLTFMLSAAMLVLIHTNHRTENIEYKTMFTPSDCRIEGLTDQQAEQLKAEQIKADTDISHLAFQAEVPGECSRNGKSFYMHKGDEAYITLMAKVMLGELPKAQDEIAAEKWVLLNLGVEPKIGQAFELQDSNGDIRSVKVSGILSDMRGNVDYGVLNLYAAQNQEEQVQHTAYITLKEDTAYDDFIKKVRRELEISGKQIRACPAREDFKELYRIDIQVMSVILFVCLVVFCGIYKIVLAAREKQYGILRALGMKCGQMYGMILLELYQVFAFGALAGTAAGIFAAWVTARISKDAGTVVYLYNESVTYHLVIPAWQIAGCIFVMAVLTGLAGCMTGRRIIRQPVVETISGAAQDRGSCLHIPGISAKAGKMQTLLALSGNYIFKNIKLSLFVTATICTGITLFTALAYKAAALRTYREDTKELWYLNGQYEMSMQGFHSPYHGVPRQDIEKIRSLKGVKDVKTSAGMLVRVIDEDGVDRDDAYYEQMNASMKKYNGYELRGYDGEHQIYKTSFFGYNESALKELEKYVISGSFDPEHIKEDEIILAVLSMDDRKEDDIAGWYKDGRRLMDYHAGDQITMKYRADFQTDSLSYETLTDSGRYISKTYTVAAVVSFDYIRSCNRNDLYPLMITSDQHMQKIVPDGCFQCIYIDTDKDLTAEGQEELERELIRIGAESDEVSTRSLAGNIKQNEMFYRKQMVYVYGTAITALILILINMANNIRYRMYVRTREICMLRAVGMSVAMARELFFIENAVLGIVSAVFAYFCSKPVLRYLYKISDLKLYGHKFAYDYPAFFAVSAAAVAICMVLSADLLKAWKTRQLAEAVGKAD